MPMRNPNLPPGPMWSWSGGQIACFVLALTALVVPMSAAVGDELTNGLAPPRVSDGELQRAYLDCSCVALRRPLDGQEAKVCSVIYETLKEQVFGGDFARLFEWSRKRPLTRCART